MLVNLPFFSLRSRAFACDEMDRVGVLVSACEFCELASQQGCVFLFEFKIVVLCVL